MQRARLAAVAAAISVGLVVVLSGCGQARPGTAALVDGARITDAQVEDVVGEYFDARVAGATTQFGAEVGERQRVDLRAQMGAWRQEALGLMVIERLARRIAQERG